MPKINVPPAMMVEVKEAMASTSDRILRLSQGNHMEDVAVVRELYGALRTMTERVASLLNKGTPINQLPPELFTRIFDLAVNRNSGEQAEQIIHLTHVCRHWRTTLLSYPRMWSTVYMQPGNPSVVSEWLARSQQVPLTIIARFGDSYEHPPCRYQDSTVAILADENSREVCPRHQAVLSLDQLLPHRSRIHDLGILLDVSDPDWDVDEGGYKSEPMLLYHPFFKGTLPNLQRLDFGVFHTEGGWPTIPIPDPLFTEDLPRLKELKYFGVDPSLPGTVKNLVSCEIGPWRDSLGPTVIHPHELQAFLNNNKTAKSLTISGCDFVTGGPQVPAAVTMTDIKTLKVHCFFANRIERILSHIHAPQFRNLDTVELSLPLSFISATATDGSGHALQFSYYRRSNVDSRLPQYFGAAITTLRLGQEITRSGLDDEPVLCEYLQSLDAVQVLEFYGPTVDFVQNALSLTGVFPNLKTIRAAVSRDDCKRTLQILAIASKRRMEEGNPLATIQPLLAGGGDGLDESLRAEWEECYKAEEIQSFLSN